jgi:mono/diheme cytochrome c family protein
MQMKRIGSIILSVVFLTCCIGLASAGEKGNARKGKYLYRKNCRTCHIDGGEAKALSPIDKEQAEWQAVFDNVKDLPCADEWEALSEKDITDIYAHLWGHAKDSPSPAKCE